MRIALVILHADPARGGAERYTIDLAEALCAAGHDVKLLATTFAESVPKDMRVELPATRATRNGRYQQFLNALDAHLAKADYDIVHAMLPVRRCDIYHPHAGIAAAAMEKWTVHFNPRRKAMAHVEKALLTSAHPPVVLALSDYVKSLIRPYYALPNDRLVRLFNAVDLHRFTPTAKSKRDFVNALIIAQDFERKGLRQAIEAMARLDSPRLKLTVVGRDDPKPYARLVEQLNANVHFAGPTNDPVAAYNDADFFVLPTRHDPCSLVVLEALAMGLPVISTAFNGACEIMSEGIHGYVLPDPDDVNALTNGMSKLIDDERRREMSEACLQLRGQLSYGHHLDELLKIYSSIVAGRTASR
jgi:UDP-glucose:(heptosyl)LPS alpha-1,3-glucosyltransferase